ncbi:hypothetical protein ACQKKX_05155 [Neorhizobium sp. NPDC001467]|uniref:hypothetical protein n=1 Tax=Neorhizobium sp. NPDC001467 TaxID=3390595 RepID=UPI003D079E7B
MTDVLPMLFLAALLVFLLGSIGIWVARRWRSSRTTVEQTPPAVSKRQWLEREADRAEVEGRR